MDFKIKSFNPLIFISLNNGNLVELFKDDDLSNIDIENYNNLYEEFFIIMEILNLNKGDIKSYALYSSFTKFSKIFVP